MFRRIITIILILLVILAILLGLSWFMARKNAVKSGTTAPTFKEFMGIGSNTKLRKLGPGTELSTDFSIEKLSGGKSGSTTGNGNTTNGGNTQTSIGSSQFTNEPMSPAGSSEFSNSLGLRAGNKTSGASSLGGSGTFGAGSTLSGGNSIGGGNGTGISTGGGSAATPICSDADTTITFTPEEITKLNILQKRFMAIAPTLSTDGDVDTELANHDTLRAKYDQISELNAYCLEKSPLIGNPVMQNRVPTPFWKGASEYFYTYGMHYHNNPNYQGKTNLADIPSAVHSLERLLRLSLW
jgi:hypothetical protein